MNAQELIEEINHLEVLVVKLGRTVDALLNNVRLIDQELAAIERAIREIGRRKA